MRQTIGISGFSAINRAISRESVLFSGLFRGPDLCTARGPRNECRFFDCNDFAKHVHFLDSVVARAWCHEFHFALAHCCGVNTVLRVS